jgi:hypothetical protein
MKRLSLALLLGSVMCSAGIVAAQEEDSADGLPEKYAKAYLIGRNTISPDKKFAVIYPTNDPDEAFRYSH